MKLQILASALAALVAAAAPVPQSGDPLSLPQAMQVAIEHNPDVQTLGHNVEQAEAQLRLAAVPLNTTANLDVSVTTNGVILFNGLVLGGGAGAGLGTGITSSFGGLTVNQTITDWGRTHTAMRAAAASLLAARANLRTKQEDVTQAVATEYYTTEGDRGLVQIDRDAWDDQKKHLAQAEEFYRVGTKARVDVAQAQASAASAELTLAQQQKTELSDYIVLNNDMGLRSAATYQLDLSLLEKIKPEPPPDPEKLVAEALQDRPEMIAALAQIDNARLNLDLAHLGLAPTLSASGSLGVSQQIIETPSWALGLNLNIPVLDGQNTHGQIQLATATLKATLSQAESERNTIYSQVQQDLLALRASTTQIQVAQEGVAYAAQSLELANGRYKAGFGSSLDYLDAVVVYSQARSSLVTAQVAYRVAETNLNRALGRDTWK